MNDESLRPGEARFYRLVHTGVCILPGGELRDWAMRDEVATELAMTDETRRDWLNLTAAIAWKSCGVCVLDGCCGRAARVEGSIVRCTRPNHPPDVAHVACFERTHGIVAWQAPAIT
ncbi:MAG: hypothetical protein IAI49_16835 [Candidatus Eremiobacteraeota bacterium]|nr:hypothetical protein [Candidatus Eremiobacteraeota bacterium]